MQKHPAALLLAALLLAALAPRFTLASEGDDSPDFQRCVASCARNGGCVSVGGGTPACVAAACGAAPMPLSLSLTFWGCEDDCKYHCMHMAEARRAAAATASSSPPKTVQYFGKWPFTRILGIQELFSVVFSLANIAAHVHNLRMYAAHTCKLQRGPSAAGAALYPYHRIWPAYGAFAINAWLWSSVFHSRDTRITDKLDYFSADAYIFAGLVVASIRTLQIRSAAARAALWLSAVALALRHYWYMLFVKFDYAWNMQLCIACGVVTAALWLRFVLSTRHPGRWTMLKYIGCLNVAMLLEVLDFAPLGGLLDAHACWHAATVPIIYLWYRFLREDVSFMVQRGGGYLSMYKGGGKQKQ